VLAITVTFGDALALVGIALAIALYAFQVAHSRRRDLEAARAVLRGVEHGMVRGWGEWFFSTVYTEEGAKQRAFQDAENVQRRGYGQVFLVPNESLASLVNSPAAGDLIDTEAVEAASLALYWVGVFNQLVQQQTDFNARHLAEIRDETLSAERRDALASAAFSISHMIHGSGVASANAEEGWYRNLCDRVEANIRELDEMARRPWWWQRWVALALTLLAASLAMAVWTFVDEDDAPASSKPASTQVGRAAGPPFGLTQSGQTLWQFEALLYDTFHTRQVSAHYSRGAAWNFGCAGSRCAPLAYWSIYFFSFRDAQRSTFHLSSRRIPAGYFGNYPILIKVKGRVVACDTAEKRFLITYGSAVGLGLACLRS
jgi:hypothetical protein